MFHTHCPMTHFPHLPGLTSVLTLTCKVTYAIVFPYKKDLRNWLRDGLRNTALGGDNRLFSTHVHTNKACFNLPVIWVGDFSPHIDGINNAFRFLYFRSSDILRPYWWQGEPVISIVKDWPVNAPFLWGSSHLKPHHHQHHTAMSLMGSSIPGLGMSQLRDNPLQLQCRNAIQEWSWGRRCLGACEKTQKQNKTKKQDASLVNSRSSKHRTVLGTCVCAPPGTATGVSSLQLLLKRLACYSYILFCFVATCCCLCDRTLDSRDSF